MPESPCSARAQFWISVYTSARSRLMVVEKYPVEKAHDSARDEANEALKICDGEGFLAAL